MKLLASLFLSVVLTASAFAQARGAALPPALQAAINAGNTSQIVSVINALSAGNPTRAAELAEQAITAAERMSATNPQAAASAAAAVVQVISRSPVQQSAPSSVVNAAATAARVLANSTVRSAAPGIVGEAAVGLIAVASAIYQSSPVASVAIIQSAQATANSPAVLSANSTLSTSAAQAVQQATQNNPGLAIALNQQSGTAYRGNDATGSSNNSISVDDRTSGGGGS